MPDRLQPPAAPPVRDFMQLMMMPGRIGLDPPGRAYSCVVRVREAAVHRLLCV